MCAKKKGQLRSRRTNDLDDRVRSISISVNTIRRLLNGLRLSADKSLGIGAEMERLEDVKSILSNRFKINGIALLIVEKERKKIWLLQNPYMIKGQYKEYQVPDFSYSALSKYRITDSVLNEGAFKFLDILFEGARDVINLDKNEYPEFLYDLPPNEKDYSPFLLPYESKQRPTDIDYLYINTGEILFFSLGWKLLTRFAQAKNHDYTITYPYGHSTIYATHVNNLWDKSFWEATKQYCAAEYSTVIAATENIEKWIDYDQEFDKILTGLFGSLEIKASDKRKSIYKVRLQNLLKDLAFQEDSLEHHLEVIIDELRPEYEKHKKKDLIQLLVGNTVINAGKRVSRLIFDKYDSVLTLEKDYSISREYELLDVGFQVNQKPGMPTTKTGYIVPNSRLTILESYIIHISSSLNLTYYSDPKEVAQETLFSSLEEDVRHGQLKPETIELLNNYISYSYKKSIGKVNKQEVLAGLFQRLKTFIEAEGRSKSAMSRVYLELLGNIHLNTLTALLREKSRKIKNIASIAENPTVAEYLFLINKISRFPYIGYYYVLAFNNKHLSEHLIFPLRFTFDEQFEYRDAHSVEITPKKSFVMAYAAVTLDSILETGIPVVANNYRMYDDKSIINPLTRFRLEQVMAVIKLLYEPYVDYNYYSKIFKKRNRRQVIGETHHELKKVIRSYESLIISAEDFSDNDNWIKDKLERPSKVVGWTLAPEILKTATKYLSLQLNIAQGSDGVFTLENLQKTSELIAISAIMGPHLKNKKSLGLKNITDYIENVYQVLGSIKVITKTECNNFILSDEQLKAIYAAWSNTIEHCIKGAIKEYSVTINRNTDFYEFNFLNYVPKSPVDINNEIFKKFEKEEGTKFAIFRVINDKEKERFLFHSPKNNLFECKLSIQI